MGPYNWGKMEAEAELSQTELDTDREMVVVIYAALRKTSHRG